MTLAAHGAAGYVTGGDFVKKDGSGTMMVTPMYVEIPTPAIKQFDSPYTAATYIRECRA